MRLTEITTPLFESAIPIGGMIHANKRMSQEEQARKNAVLSGEMSLKKYVARSAIDLSYFAAVGVANLAVIYGIGEALSIPLK